MSIVKPLNMIDVSLYRKDYDLYASIEDVFGHSGIIGPFVLKLKTSYITNRSWDFYYFNLGNVMYAR